jgi:6-hydroxycyclohex-1-ene-1-carbonyl-CoA dehydrogenase
MKISSWMVEKLGEPMVRQQREDRPGAAQALVEIAGCGVCHTDLGFYYDGVPTHHPLPLVLGHEISGTVVDAGAGAENWVGRDVIVPAVIPCGTCEACAAGHGSVCASQVFPGNDVHGGFGTHTVVPAHGLCPVPSGQKVDLATLSVIADAVSTPYQAILRSELRPGDVAVFVGVGGVGGFGAQIAAAMGAHVVALDVDEGRLSALASHGVSLALRPDELDPKELKRRVRSFAKERGTPSWRVRIFETSGTTAGQTTAFGLLVPGCYLSVVGYTPEKASLRISNLMAFDAVAQGNWGCLPEHYPDVLELVLSGKIVIEPFVEKRPLTSINETFEELRAHKLSRRPILVPEK